MLDNESDLHPEDWYRQVFETAPDALVVVGADERIAYVHLQTERLFGHPRAALIGRTLAILIPNRFRAGHGKHVAKYFATPSTRPMGSGLELFGERADGTEIAIEVSLSPIHTPAGTLVSAAIRDISERKQ